MSQTRRQSITETVCNYIVGFALAWILNRYVLHWMGYPVKISETTSLTAIFTAVSVIHSYVVRRVFNYLHRPRTVRAALVINVEEFMKP